jgi:type IV pilus assembly protein PilQ
MKNNRLAKVIEGNVVRIGTLDAFKEEEKSREELKRAKETITDIIKVNYATASDLVDKVTPLLTESGEIKTDTRTNSIVIRDIPERIDDARRLVKALDMPEHQVEIESRIISASRDYARSIGVQVGFVIGNLERITVGGPNTFGTIGGTRPSATPSSTYSAGNDVTGRGASQAQATENAAISVGTEGNNQRGNYNWSFPAQGATSGIGISVGNILDTFLLDASITAAESNGQVRIISQPKVQAQNNRAATIEQGIQFPVQVVENNTVTVRFFSASLKLSVLPQITEEGTVLMKITVENNRADFVNTVNGIPSIITSMSSTEVLVADGGTTVIGGILLDTDQRNTDKVPYLGDIPILGTFFRRDTNQKQTQEILFFLTPRIIK